MGQEEGLDEDPKWYHVAVDYIAFIGLATSFVYAGLTFGEVVNKDECNNYKYEQVDSTYLNNKTIDTLLMKEY